MKYIQYAIIMCITIVSHLQSMDHPQLNRDINGGSPKGRPKSCEPFVRQSIDNQPVAQCTTQQTQTPKNTAIKSKDEKTH